MKSSQLDFILDAASKEVHNWPLWMQLPENRQRQPSGNTIMKPEQENQIYYSVPIYNEIRKLQLEHLFNIYNCSLTKNDITNTLKFLVIRAAENFCNYYGVNEENDWPLEIVLYQGLRGPEIGRFTVNMELKPTFTVEF